jgi:hypothetical protein
MLNNKLSRMKKLHKILLMLLIAVNLSFTNTEPAAFPLAYTKWISANPDECNEALCFTSVETVILYRDHLDKDSFLVEIGYEVSYDTVFIHAYSSSTLDPASRLVLIYKNDTLRQSENAQNPFCRIFVKVPGEECE